ncbi:MAG: hypothetical protein ACJAXB_001502 [Candidatus Endobugula sp.]|jgi:hypothetical protein
MQTITWNDFTIQTDFHAAPPAASAPGLGNGNLWLPANVVKANGNLQLSLQQNSGQYYYNSKGVKIEIWAAAEAVIQQAVTYGTYYCTFKFTDGAGNSAWEQFAISNSSPNITTIFGLFLFDPVASNHPNTHSEIDFIEVGYQNQPNNGSGWIGQQPGGPSKNNAQFLLQPWDATTPNQPDWDILKRIAIDVSQIPASGEVTVKVKWTAVNSPVEYSLAYGAYDSSNFPTTEIITHTTPASVNTYVPAPTSTMQLHLNLWPYGGPSSGEPVFCEITNLEMP